MEGERKMTSTFSCFSWSLKELFIQRPVIQGPSRAVGHRAGQALQICVHGTVNFGLALICKSVTIYILYLCMCTICILHHMHVVPYAYWNRSFFWRGWEHDVTRKSVNTAGLFSQALEPQSKILPQSTKTLVSSQLTGTMKHLGMANPGGEQVKQWAVQCWGPGKAQHRLDMSIYPGSGAWMLRLSLHLGLKALGLPPGSVGIAWPRFLRSKERKQRALEPCFSL